MIFVDLDGVLADFEKAVNKIFQANNLPLMSDPHWKNNDDEFWEVIQPSAEFWAGLEPIPNGFKVWNSIKHLNPHILSAYTSSNALECKIGKRMWIEKHGLVKDAYNGRVHLVRRSEKKNFAKSGVTPNVLIDDFDKNCQEFEQAGGIAIQFTGNINTTIKELKNLKLL